MFDNDPDMPRFVLHHRVTDERVMLPPEVCVGYMDNRPDARIISSRRVEEAVETADYLKRCAEEGLCVTHEFGEWSVSMVIRTLGSRVVKVAAEGVGKTLREAYYRYHGAGDAA